MAPGFWILNGNTEKSNALCRRREQGFRGSSQPLETYSPHKDDSMIYVGVEYMRSASGGESEVGHPVICGGAKV